MLTAIQTVPNSFGIGTEAFDAAMTFNEGEYDRAHGSDVTRLYNNKRQNLFLGPMDRIN